MAEQETVLISIDPAFRDRLKVHAAKIKKTMKEIVDSLIEEYLKNKGE